MSSWGNIDNAANAPLWAAHSVNLRANSTNITSLFDNTTANSFAVTLGDGSTRLGNTTIGVFAIDAQEEAVSEKATAGKFAHSGWNLVTTGQGGRAGRVQTETLVCLNTVVGDSDGQTYANVSIVLTGLSNQTVNSSTSNANVAVFTVTPTLTGNTSAALTYQWQVNNQSGSLGWTNVANATPANTTYTIGTNTLDVYPYFTDANSYVYRVVVTAADEGVSVTSANATLTVPA